jgi:four helix bundle protein
MGLRIYEEALVFAAQMKPVLDRIAVSDSDLARQGRKAVPSIVLNTAEGSRQRAGKGRNRFEDAFGSADESRAILQVSVAMGYIEPQPELVAEALRIANVLRKLARG